MFEAVTKNVYPWAQFDTGLQKVLRYGHCPECHGAMQLINSENPNPQKVPHGRHRLKHVEGFDHCLERILGCSLLDQSKKLEIAEENAVLTPEAVELRTFLIENFNLVAGMFTQVTGIALSLNMFRQMLRIYLENGWYRWKTATKGNLPWVLGRVTYNFNLYGQVLREGSPVRAAVLSRVPAAGIGPRGQLLRVGEGFVAVDFGLREHTVRYDQSGTVHETIIFHVHRKDVDDLAGAMIYEEVLDIRPDAFLARVANKTEPRGYGADLVAMARETLEAYLTAHPEARAPAGDA